ncbi:PilZ domain-containing protein [Sphingomonas sp. RP10(2022)]|uniref:PilZ domain-containing protein n=1 Tax=Sphingomonas liriopis TaxID=2949094 RepID=A0A9X2HSD4_9SPHN|nr:PilZ domain-containing protein [Sphingomonas liriopis]MCP3735007.1 PilZ domain-containing protein [Sphingomonas liriopis]
MPDRYGKGRASRRDGVRHKVFVPTTMTVHLARERVHLLDLSAHGALIHAAAPPPKGMSIRIECAGRLRRARVMWAGATRFGVAFTLSLSDDQLAAALAEQQRAASAHGTAA